MADETDIASDGSSPHTRGSDRVSGPGHAAARFIPAHAGISTGPSCAPVAQAVHPRTRGDQTSYARPTPARSGSSPHTRGSVLEIGIVFVKGRFIPAHAGIRARALSIAAFLSVHSRTRGDQCTTLNVTDSGSGSSPHTRGSVRAAWRLLLRRRFIPAHAGIRNYLEFTGAGLTVHPRTRGDQSGVCSSHISTAGSSPHTRGSGASSPDRPEHQRFIPAHAGISASASRTAGDWPVHPRTRGDQNSVPASGPSMNGSSPHTRGSVMRACGELAHLRFIPAHAGIRMPVPPVTVTTPVHPRTRGDQGWASSLPRG